MVLGESKMHQAHRTESDRVKNIEFELLSLCVRRIDEYPVEKDEKFESAKA